jgi:hypothetical protein
MARKKTSRASRKTKQRRRRRPTRAICRDTSADDFTIQEWCAKRRVSRGTFYKLRKQGTAPRTHNVNKCVRISHKADAEWQAEREAATAAEVAA